MSSPGSNIKNQQTQIQDPSTLDTHVQVPDNINENQIETHTSSDNTVVSLNPNSQQCHEYNESLQNKLSVEPRLFKLWKKLKIGLVKDNSETTPNSSSCNDSNSTSSVQDSTPLPHQTERTNSVIVPLPAQNTTNSSLAVTRVHQPKVKFNFLRRCFRNRYQVSTFGGFRA